MTSKLSSSTDLPTGPPGCFHFSKVGKPLKSPDPDIIICWGKFNKAAMTWINQFHEYMVSQQSWYYGLEGSYFGADLIDHSYGYLNEIRVMAPKVVKEEWPLNYQTKMGRIRVRLIETHLDPLEQLQSEIITADGVYHTWPTEDGKFKLWIHKHSRLAAFKYQCGPSKTHINRANLDKATEWNLLADYVKACNKAGVEIARQDICDLVRQISNVQVDKAQAEELKRVGIEVEDEE